MFPICALFSRFSATVCECVRLRECVCRMHGAFHGGNIERQVCCDRVIRRSGRWQTSDATARRGLVITLIDKRISLRSGGSGKMICNNVKETCNFHLKRSVRRKKAPRPKGERRRLILREARGALKHLVSIRCGQLLRLRL